MHFGRHVFSIWYIVYYVPSQKYLRYVVHAFCGWIVWGCSWALNSPFLLRMHFIEEEDYRPPLTKF